MYVNTLLHYSINNNVSTLTDRNHFSQRPSTPTFKTSPHQLPAKENEILLPSVQVKIIADDGTFVTLRALVDQGSQVNLITKNPVLLWLPRNKLSGIYYMSGYI